MSPQYEHCLSGAPQAAQIYPSYATLTLPHFIQVGFLARHFRFSSSIHLIHTLPSIATVLPHRGHLFPLHASHLSPFLKTYTSLHREHENHPSFRQR